MPHLADLDLQLSPYNADARVINAAEGVVALTPPRTKVAIVGAGEGKHFAPYRDDTYEVWGLNAVPPLDYQGMLRCDRWFEMHVMAAQNEKDMEWISRCPVPLYLVPQTFDGLTAKAIAEHFVNGPHNSAVHVMQPVRYPLERIEARFGGYFACTFAYQIALALSEGFEAIGLYGVELCYGTERERTVEWACVSWWMGLAEGLGVRLELPPHSRLANHTYRYGIEYYEEKSSVEKYVEMMRKSDGKREGIGG